MRIQSHIIGATECVAKSSKKNQQRTEGKLECRQKHNTTFTRATKIARGKCLHVTPNDRGKIATKTETAKNRSNSFEYKRKKCMP